MELFKSGKEIDHSESKIKTPNELLRGIVDYTEDQYGELEKRLDDILEYALDNYETPDEIINFKKSFAILINELRKKWGEAHKYSDDIDEYSTVEMAILEELKNRKNVCLTKRWTDALDIDYFNEIPTDEELSE